jgi:hypothetical protein
MSSRSNLDLNQPIKDFVMALVMSGITVGVRLLIFELLSRGYVLIKGGYV